MAVLSDSAFLDELVSYIVRDIRFLREHGHAVRPEDFTKSRDSSHVKERGLVAELALNHWERTREPLGGVLLTKLTQHARIGKWSQEKGRALVSYGRDILGKPLTGYNTIARELLDWKTQIIYSDAMDEFLTAQEAGTLTPERFLQLANDAQRLRSKFGARVQTFDEEMDERLDQREDAQARRYYLSLIDPLDDMVRLISKGMLLMFLAPYKRGKSLALIWMAVAYAIQKLKVLYITLEDPKPDVDERFDSLISDVPIKELRGNRDIVKERVTRFFKNHRGRFKTIDGTGAEMTVEDVEQIWTNEREGGFDADAVIVDYLEELHPSAHMRRMDKRHQLSSITAALRRFASRENLLVLSAAQTQRYTADLKVIDGDTVAEDISILRKATVTLGLGKGEFEDVESIYLSVAAHKHDLMGQGVNIVTDRAKACIYDPIATRVAAKKWRIKMAMDAVGAGAPRKAAKKQRPNYRKPA